MSHQRTDDPMQGHDVFSDRQSLSGSPSQHQIAEDPSRELSEKGNSSKSTESSSCDGK